MATGRPPSIINTQLTPTLSEATPLLDGGDVLLNAQDSETTLYPESHRSGCAHLFVKLWNFVSSFLPSLGVLLTCALYYGIVWQSWSFIMHSRGMPKVTEPCTQGPCYGFEMAHVQKHIETMCARPHMYNSDENLRVREYILNQLQNLQKLSHWRNGNHSRLEVCFTSVIKSRFSNMIQSTSLSKTCILNLQIWSFVSEEMLHPMVHFWFHRILIVLRYHMA